MGAERRHALLAWARGGRRLIVEDDYDAEFRYDRRPLAALQGLDPARVAYVGTASKTLAPALRLGWVLAPPRARARAGRVQARRRPGLARARPDRARRPLRLRRARAPPAHASAAPTPSAARCWSRSSARAVPGSTIEGAAAGVHLVLALPEPLDAARLAAATAAHGVAASSVESYARRPPADRAAARAGLRADPDAVGPPGGRRAGRRAARRRRLTSRCVGRNPAGGPTAGAGGPRLRPPGWHTRCAPHDDRRLPHPRPERRRAHARLRAALPGAPRGAGRAVRRGASPRTVRWLHETAAELRAGDAAAGAALSELVAEAPAEEVEPCIRACALQLQLANIAEERERVRRRRHYDATGVRQRESLMEAADLLRDDGADLAAAVRALHVELVLTAHPTEATRRSVLDHQLRIARLLDGLDDPRIGRSRRRALLGELREALTLWWQTDEVRRVRPMVEDEVRRNLFFFEATLHEAVPRCSRSSSAVRRPRRRPRASLRVAGPARTWTGIPRSGPRRSPRTLSLHRRAALRLLRARRRPARRALLALRAAA